jgi:transcriptional regulator of met regulon
MALKDALMLSCCLPAWSCALFRRNISTFAHLAIEQNLWCAACLHGFVGNGVHVSADLFDK